MADGLILGEEIEENVVDKKEKEPQENNHIHISLRTTLTLSL